MSKRSKAEDRIGKFFLKQFDGVWKICWYDEQTEQTRKITTNETDRDRARTKLAEYTVINSHPKTVQQDAKVKDILTRYRQGHGRTIRSFRRLDHAIKVILDFWGHDIMASEITIGHQQRLIDHLRTPALRGGATCKTKKIAPLADSTILGVFTSAWPAFTHAYEDKLIPAIPPRISNERWNPYLPNNDRVYTLDELSRIFNVAGGQGGVYHKQSRFSREHWWRYCVIALGTSARPEAILDLHSDQVDFRNNVIDLNPPGRKQNPKKRRNRIPMCPTLARWLHAWGPGQYVTYYGRPLGSTEFWDNLKVAAGDESMFAYAMRHTVATWLGEDDENDVPVRQIDYLMGHMGEGSKTGLRYRHPSPKKMPQLVASLERLYRELAMLVRSRDLLQPAASDYNDPPQVQRLPVAGMVGVRQWGLERVKGFEPSTSTLATSRSTTELHPQFPADQSLTENDRASTVPIEKTNLLILQQRKLEPDTLARDGESNQDSHLYTLSIPKRTA